MPYAVLPKEYVKRMKEIRATVDPNGVLLLSSSRSLSLVHAIFDSYHDPPNWTLGSGKMSKEESPQQPATLSLSDASKCSFESYVLTRYQRNFQNYICQALQVTGQSPCLGQASRVPKAISFGA
ncbi:uncharacterized protein BDW43DRAFT_72733 [Aspergillus alliaceus]|uniref:uncharacterized protein n=1 Tax=Petromyces alliaceus TaxID=209559 RepID=UPI0012A76592|nr:uncharacterized protein BDW43DRAFT_72733 [Aspergillus alliaceus]KAB8239054.1 hypothetical protein BDW43DRAFT_72733 [Aspergillus alliaceus]